MMKTLGATLLVVGVLVLAVVALLAFIVLAAHITFWGALLVFFLVPAGLVKMVEDWERYRRAHRATQGY